MSVTYHPSESFRFMKSYLMFAVKLILTVLIFYWVLHDSGNFLGAMQNANPIYLILAAAGVVAMYAGGALRWSVLLKAQGIERPFIELFSLTMQGYFFTIFIPGGAVSGDVIKAGLLVRRSKEGTRFNAAFSILMDRIVGLVALFSATLISAVIFLDRILALSKAVQWQVWVLILFCVAGLTASGTLFLNKLIFYPKFMKSLLAVLDRYSKDAFSNAINAIETYRANSRALLTAFLVSILALVPLMIFSLTVLLKATSNDPIIPGECAMASLMSNVAAAVPLTPGGVGIRDMISKEMLRSAGASSTTATAATLLYTALIFGISLTGGIFYLFDGRLQKTEGKKT